MRCKVCQFGAYPLPFMQLSKASRLLPAPDAAALRSQSEASRLRVLGFVSVVLRGLDGGGGGAADWLAHPAKRIIAATN